MRGDHGILGGRHRRSEQAKAFECGQAHSGFVGDRPRHADVHPLCVYRYKKASTGEVLHRVDVDCAGEVDTVLNVLEQVRWEQAYLEIPTRMTALQAQVEALLARIAEVSPGALAGAAAYLTGVVAVKNVFTPLECQDDMHKHMTAVVNALSGNNEGCFMQYLAKGFEAIRNREPDELARCRIGSVVSHPPTSRRVESVSELGG